VATALRINDQSEVSGQHGETTRVEGRHHARDEGKTDEVLIQGQDVSACTRSLNSCWDIAAIGLFTKVEVPSARRNT